MPVIKTNPKTKPRCPNHGCELVDFPFPMPTKGTATCPESGAKFDFEAEVDQETMTKDASGNIVKGAKWKLTGDEQK